MPLSLIMPVIFLRSTAVESRVYRQGQEEAGLVLGMTKSPDFL